MRIKITSLLVDKARGLVQTNPDYSKHYSILLQRQQIWSSKHYSILACMMDMSVASVKRMFDLPGHKAPKALSESTENKLMSFLGLSGWDELEQIMLDTHSSSNGKNDRELLMIKKEIKNIQTTLTSLQRQFEVVYSYFEKHGSDK